MSSRLLKDHTWLRVAKLISEQSTCVRRKVGCVLINTKGHVAATGWNGSPSDMPHCIDSPCAGAHFASGQGLSQCEATHAEINALIHCHDIYELETAYVTTAPCLDCIKPLITTSLKRIVFLEDYPHAEVSRQRWITSGNIKNIIRTWEPVNLFDT